MKRIYLIVLTMLLPVMIWAQTPVSIPRLDLGIKIGANFDKLDGNTWDNGYKAGYLGGVFVGLRGKRMGVQLEGFFSQTHYTTTGTQLAQIKNGVPQLFSNAYDSTKNGNFRAGYFNIPVLFELKLVPMLWFQIGPEYSGLVSVKDVNGFVTDAKGLFKSGYVSGVAGLELKLPLHLDAGVRYVLGFSDMNNTGISGAWQQRTIQAHVGFTFL